MRCFAAFIHPTTKYSAAYKDIAERPLNVPLPNDVSWVLYRYLWEGIESKQSAVPLIHQTSHSLGSPTPHQTALTYKVDTLKPLNAPLPIDVIWLPCRS